MSVTLEDRMDRRDVESGPRLHQDQPRLQALLRRDVRRALPRRAGPSLRAGLRPAARPARSWPSRSAGRSRRMIFVNSMSDLFHKDVPDEYIAAVCRRHAAGATGTPIRC